MPLWLSVCWSALPCPAVPVYCRKLPVCGFPLHLPHTDPAGSDLIDTLQITQIRDQKAGCFSCLQDRSPSGTVTFYYQSLILPFVFSASLKDSVTIIITTETTAGFLLDLLLIHADFHKVEIMASLCRIPLSQVHSSARWHRFQTWHRNIHIHTDHMRVSKILINVGRCHLPAAMARITVAGPVTQSPAIHRGMGYLPSSRLR